MGDSTNTAIKERRAVSYPHDCSVSVWVTPPTQYGESKNTVLKKRRERRAVSYPHDCEADGFVGTAVLGPSALLHQLYHELVFIFHIKYILHTHTHTHTHIHTNTHTHAHAHTNTYLHAHTHTHTHTHTCRHTYTHTHTHIPTHTHPYMYANKNCTNLHRKHTKIYNQYIFCLYI